MIDQAYISKSLEGLQGKFLSKYNLREYYDSLRPLAIFGMYSNEDLEVLLNHKNRVVLIWQGCDAQRIPETFIPFLRASKIQHIAISHWIKESLDTAGIYSTLIPIHATTGEGFECCPKGDSIYFYSSDLSEESANYHGENFLSEIKERTGLNVIRATYNTYTKEELVEVYKQCFINLRLTSYDGCPNTNLEMGAMGRRSIFNGEIPTSIQWVDLDDICQIIIHEYQNRRKPNDKISKEVLKFINIPNNIFKRL